MIGKPTRPLLLAMATGFAITFAIVAFGASLLAGPDDEDVLEVVPFRDEPREITSSENPPKVPRPDEDNATSLESARDELRDVEEVDSVIEAMIAKDRLSLIDAAVQADFCAQQFRAAPEECGDKKEVIGVYLEAGSTRPALRPAIVVEAILQAVLADDSVELNLIARESTGDRRYYLVFKAAKSVEFDGNSWDSVGIVVDPAGDRPIQWFYFMAPSDNGVRWLQAHTEAEATGFDLIAPESVRDWPGLWGEKGE